MSIAIQPQTKIIFIILQIFLASCSGLEKSEQEKIREQNLKGEYIYRKQSEVLYPVQPPKQRTRTTYPWETQP